MSNAEIERLITRLAALALQEQAAEIERLTAELAERRRRMEVMRKALWFDEGRAK